VQCLGTALESGDLSPLSKRKSTKKNCFGDKIVNCVDGSVLLVLLIDGGEAVLCAFGLFGGGNRGFSNPCPPLNLLVEGSNGERSERRWGEGETSLLQHLLASLKAEKKAQSKTLW